MCPVICDAMKNRFLIRKILFRQDINLLLVKLVSSKRYQVKTKQLSTALSCIDAGEDVSYATD